MTIAWTAAEPRPFTVRYGRDGKMDRKLTVQPIPRPVEYPKRPRPPGTEAATVREYQYLARLSSLVPGTACRYEVGAGVQSAVEGPRSAAGTFRTLLGPGRPFTFLVCGDSQAPDGTQRTAANFARHDPWLIVHVGDMVQHGGYWPNMNAEFFRPLAGLASRVPVLPTVGNHDSWRVLGRLFRPGVGPNYSYDCGDVHFVCLDAFAGESKIGRIREWLERDLSGTRARWKVVYHHKAVYDVGAHHEHWGRSDFLPIYRRHGVDLVFAGHSHAYQRFHPMFTPGENGKHPITHVITGPMGGYFHYLDDDPYLAAGAAYRYTYVVVEASAASLRLRAFDSDGEQIDEFTIRKDSAGRLSDFYIVDAVDESGFGRLRQLMEPSVRGAQVLADPRSGRPVPVRLEIPALDRPVTFTLELEKVSSRSFELTPFSGRCPAGRSTPVELRVRLRESVRYADPKIRLPVLRLKCAFEIDGVKASVHSGRLNYRAPVERQTQDAVAE